MNVVVCPVGTPTEENWPGISSIEEFKSYNFPKYKPQPFINHAPRYICVSTCVCMLTISYPAFCFSSLRFTWEKKHVMMWLGG